MLAVVKTVNGNERSLSDRDDSGDSNDMDEVSQLATDSSERVTSLLNALRYTTRNASSATTPKAVKAMLGV